MLVCEFRMCSVNVASFRAFWTPLYNAHLRRSYRKELNVAYNDGMRLLLCKQPRWCSANQTFLKCWYAYLLCHNKKSYSLFYVQIDSFREQFYSGFSPPWVQLSRVFIQTMEILALLFVYRWRLLTFLIYIICITYLMLCSLCLLTFSPLNLLCIYLLLVFTVLWTFHCVLKSIYLSCKIQV